MAQELKELCQLLYPDSSTANAEYFSDISEYIRELGSQDWDHICKEPERLTEEMKQLTEQTQDLAFTNYKTFVESADVSRAIMKDLGKSKDSLSLFLDTMPSFVQECESFSQMAGNIVKEKSRHGRARAQSDKLLALLELPSLMREALNAEDYESALDIFTFIRNLSNRYSEIPFIQSTTSEIMTLWFETLYHLFNRLRYDLPLPQCLQILGYLRRANTVYKSTGEALPLDASASASASAPASASDGLHLHFLKARNAWFENALEEAKNSESAAAAAAAAAAGGEKVGGEKAVRRVVELHRVHLLNIVTQHKSIFLSDEEELDGGGVALSCWLKQKVEALAPLVEASVEGGAEGGGEEAAEGAVSQWHYLGAACARAAADPRGALEPRLCHALLAALTARLRRALHRFTARLARYTPACTPPPPAGPTPHAGDEPPGELVDYYPLAEFLNALLAALNALRGAAPLSLALPVHTAYREALRAGARAVAAAGGAVARQYAEAVVPHAARCVARALPAAPVAEALGVPLSQLQDSRLLLLDPRDICQCFEAIPHFTWS